MTANAGSVLVLQGRPGASVVTLHHVKQPASEVGPLMLTHDHSTGRTAVTAAPDLVFVIESSGNPAGMTVAEVAAEVCGVPDPTEAQKKKIKRQLQALVRRSALVVDDSGLGLESQRAAIEAECARRGWTLVSLSEGAGMSGKSMRRREGLAAALQVIQHGAAPLFRAATIRFTTSSGNARGRPSLVPCARLTADDHASAAQ